MANLSHLPAQWRQSGLSQRAFCEREGVRLATFSYWRTKELQTPPPKPSATAPAANAFTEVRVEPNRRPAANAPAIEIHFPDGTRVSIPLPTAAASSALLR